LKIAAKLACNVGLAIALLPARAVAQPNAHFSVYFLAVGSGDYVRAEPPGHGFEDLDGADASAERMAALLARNGATFGILLESRPNRFVTRADVFGAINDVVRRIRQDHTRRPLFVFYWMGHGVSEGIGWNHYSIPGNFTYRADADLTVDNLSKNAIYDGDIADVLDKSGAAYAILLDNCASGKAQQFASGVLTREAAVNVNDVAAVIRVMNEFRQPNPVIFSARPGTDVAPVRDPRGDGTVLLGPLARRATIIVAAHNPPNVSLGTFVRALSSATLDPVSKPGVTYASYGESWTQLIFLSGQPAAEIVKKTGSATP
jgi:hypothetical protein